MMIIFDTSTLILLAKIEILKTIAQNHEILISQEVKIEAACKPELLDAKIIIKLIKDKKIGVVRVKRYTVLKKLQEDFILA